MDSSFIINLIFAFLLFLIIFIVFFRMVLRERKIKKEGITVEGTIIVESVLHRHYYSNVYYATYKTIEGELIEKASILSFDFGLSKLKTGDRIILKYLNSNPYEVIFIEKIDDYS